MDYFDRPENKHLRKPTRPEDIFPTFHRPDLEAFPSLPPHDHPSRAWSPSPPLRDIEPTQPPPRASSHIILNHPGPHGLHIASSDPENALRMKVELSGELHKELSDYLRTAGGGHSTLAAVMVMTRAENSRPSSSSSVHHGEEPVIIRRSSSRNSGSFRTRSRSRSRSRSNSAVEPVAPFRATPHLQVFLCAIFRHDLAQAPQFPEVALEVDDLMTQHHTSRVPVVFLPAELVSPAFSGDPNPRTPLLSFAAYTGQYAVNRWKVLPEALRVRNGQRLLGWDRLEPASMVGQPENHLDSLPEALRTVLDLAEHHLYVVSGGNPAYSPLPRNSRVHEWVAELNAVERSLAAGHPRHFVDPSPAPTPLHYVGQLAWCWTGQELCLFEVVASGDELVELLPLLAAEKVNSREWQTKRGVHYDWHAGVPVYSNTLLNPEFRLLGILQGGSTHRAFLTPYSFLHDAVSNSVKEEHDKFRHLHFNLVPELPQLIPPEEIRRRDRVRSGLLDVPGQTSELLRGLSPSRLSPSRLLKRNSSGSR
ncbi:hypothetical protein JCM6882_000025 [Rhodosporidiobolus microsporus]